MGKINIFIKTTENKTVCLIVPNDSTISFVKMMIEDKMSHIGLSFPHWENCYLTNNSKVLSDDYQTLTELNIQRDDTIWMNLRVSNNYFLSNKEKLSNL